MPKCQVIFAQTLSPGVRSKGLPLFLQAPAASESLVDLYDQPSGGVPFGPLPSRCRSHQGGGGCAYTLVNICLQEHSLLERADAKQ